MHLGSDIQNGVPATRLALSRVGVTGLERVLRLSGNGRGTAFFAVMDLFVYLESHRAGVHMSRFIENIEAVASDISSESAPDCETLAERMALAIAQTQGSVRSEVHIRARYSSSRSAPVSGIPVKDLYTFIGIAASDGQSTRRAVGVEVNGLTVCPCAHEMISEYSRELLLKSGYSREQSDEIVSMLPLASHNQRGLATLIIGTESRVRAEELVRIAESSMSSEIYELLKRPDELHVVKKAHFKPRFVEDVVREMLRMVGEYYVSLPDDAFILAKQENFESIHTHNAYAERCAYIGDIRRELSGLECGGRSSLSLETWLSSLY